MYKRGEYLDCIRDLRSAFDHEPNIDVRLCCFRIGQDHCERFYLNPICTGNFRCVFVYFFPKNGIFYSVKINYKTLFSFLPQEWTKWHYTVVRPNQTSIEKCYRHNCYIFPFHWVVIALFIVAANVVYFSLQYFRFKKKRKNLRSLF